ncbi:MAG: STAS domain-containing protein [Burkholderiaceae bacterium]|jgi:phospholipid transport system transporter-binding protein
MSATGVMTSLPASVTLKDAPAILESLRQSFAADGGDVWRIDAAPVTQLDTSALAVLLECSRMAAAGKRKMQIVNAPARMSDLAHLYGVDELLGVEVEAFEPAAQLGESRPADIPVIPILR